jgi:hypothetical protein
MVVVVVEVSRESREEGVVEYESIYQSIESIAIVPEGHQMLPVASFERTPPKDPEFEHPPKIKISIRVRTVIYIQREHRDLWYRHLSLTE